MAWTRNTTHDCMQRITMGKMWLSSLFIVSFGQNLIIKHALGRSLFIFGPFQFSFICVPGIL